MLDQLTLAAGDLTHRITIKKQVPTYDEYNRPVKVTDGSDWQAIQPTGSFWATIEPLSGREILVAKEVAPSATHMIRMRYVAGITDKMQAYFGKEKFDINSIIDVLKRKVQLKLYVTESPGAS
jgi:SPP1 family predicted phage head-tail adaptor